MATNALVNFYISRMERLSDKEAKTEYLENTVVAGYRDAVKARYNELHPEEPMD